MTNKRKRIRLKAGDSMKGAKYSVEPDNQEEPLWASDRTSKKVNL